MAVQIKKEQIKNSAIDASKLDQTVNYSFSGQVRYTGSDTNTQALATRGYVDSVAAGLDPKDSCKVATTGNITLSGTQTIDGVGVSAGDRVLVKDQSTASENGIYVCSASGWARATDMAAGSDAAGASMFIEQGTANSDKGFVCTTNKGSDVVGTNALAFSQYTGVATIEAGAALSKTGERLDVEVDGSSIEVSSDALRVKAAGITDAMLAGGISNAKLANSTISGIALGSPLAALTPGTNSGLAMSDAAGFNGSAARQIAVSFSGGTLDSDSNGIKVASSGIGTLQIADSAVTNGKLAGSISASKLTLGTAFANASDNLTLANGVAGNGLALSAGQVLSVDLNGTTLALSADGLKINDDGVGAAQLADNAVGTAAVADSAITNAKLAGSITAAKLAGSIPADKLNLGQGVEESGGNLQVKLDGSSLARGASGIKVADGGIGASQITDGVIAGAKLSFAPKFVVETGMNGSQLTFDLSEAIDAALLEGTVAYLNGLALQRVAGSPGADQYTVANDGAGGVGRITFGSGHAPYATDTLSVLYFG